MIIPYKLNKILNENVSPNEVIQAMNNKQQVIITYDNEEQNAPLERVIEPYVYGITKAGNDAIRAFQYYGDTYRGVPKWKLFRLDRIKSWKPTNNHFNQPPHLRGWRAEPYNETGDGSLIRILNQISLQNDESDTLSDLRKKTQNIHSSTPISNNDFNQLLKRNLEITRKEKEKRKFKLSDTPYGHKETSNHIKQEIPNTTVQNKNDDFEKMLKRNLEITRKEKEKRKFNINKSGPLNNDYLQQEIVPQTIDNSQNNKNDDFEKMLKRNLEITRKEKEKRKFNINNIK